MTSTSVNVTHNTQLKPFLRLRLRHSDVATCREYCFRYIPARTLRRLLGVLCLSRVNCDELGRSLRV